jgi:hypothetical protein
LFIDVKKLRSRNIKRRGESDVAKEKCKWKTERCGKLLDIGRLRKLFRKISK